MATLENIAKRRAVALNSITDALISQAAARSITLRPFPVLLRQQDPNHRELALVEWIHDGLVAIGVVALPGTPDAPQASPDGPVETDLGKLTKEKLLGIAKERNITTVTAANTKADIIQALSGTPDAPQASP